MAGTSSSTLSTQAPGSTPRRSNETIPNFSRPHTPRSQTAPPEPQDLYHPAEVTSTTAGMAIAGEPVRLEIAPVTLEIPIAPEPEPEYTTTITPDSILPGLAIADLPTASIPGLAIAEPPGDISGIAMSDADPGPADIDTPLLPRPSITQRPPTAASTTSSTSPPPHTRRARIAIVDAPPPPTRGGADSKSIRSQIAPSICSPEDEVLSLKVRSLYDSGVGGSDAGSQFSKRVSSIMEEGGKRTSRVSRNSFVGSGDERFAEEEEEEAEAEERRIKEALEAAAIEEEEAAEEKRELERSVHLRAGGAEDWEDLNGSDVDRYGFIHATTTRHSAPAGTAPPSPRVFTPPRRVSTALHLHSTTPQKRSHHLHLRISPFAHAAPEMLRSPLPGATALLREKENSRAKKWREMAIVRKRSERGDEGGRGGGCEWGFVTGDPKLVSRTWKGIPDCWRAAAWHAFLTASRKRRGIGRGDGELVEMYAEFITRPSADDVQIDLDVPRTINSHIMFRRRYRGGQRLLFRVLHALSLYFPAMGYVQGMASLAATLLCYYDEETAFVMLIRMFELRGLEKLYQAGFGGLMSALEEFESGWIRGGAVSRKLNHLGIGPTTYGTRWYLTLFNYSMPFPAQLRVWDVFMLLGDPDVISESKSVSSPLGTAPPPAAPGGESAISVDEGFGGTLDILHATSAALIDSMKDIIVRSDFEGAMKVLTSWIPVKDEELLMKVAKSEWKMRKRRRGGGGGVGGAHHHPGRASLGT